MDDYVNFAYSTVATAPSPASSGTSLVVAGGTWPDAPFNAVVHAANASEASVSTGAEVVRVTDNTAGTFTIERATEGPNGARSIVVGDTIRQSVTAEMLNQLRVGQPLGQIYAVEAYAGHDVSTGSLPVIDGCQTIEGCVVYINTVLHADTERGPWVVHEFSAWERPSWCADGMTFPGGQIVHCIGGNGNVQFNDVLITFDNGADASLPFTVGVDTINSDSIQLDGEGEGFPNVKQGPFAPLWFGTTDETSVLGAGAWTWFALGAPTGFDFAGMRLVNLPEPTDATEAATKNYVQTHTPRVVTPAITTSYTIDASVTDLYVVAGQSSAVTFALPSGSPVQGQRLMIRLKDNGTPRAITWNGVFRGSGSLALPTTTTTSKTMYASFVYNSTDSKWDMISLLDNF